MAHSHWQGNLAAFLVGLGFGAGLAFLFAPMSGVHTRYQITATVKDRVDNLVDRGSELGRRAQWHLENLKEDVRDAAEVGSLAYGEANQ